MTFIWGFQNKMYQNALQHGKNNNKITQANLQDQQSKKTKKFGISCLVLNLTPKYFQVQHQLQSHESSNSEDTTSKKLQTFCEDRFEGVQAKR